MKDDSGLYQALKAFAFLGSIGVYFCVVVGIFVYLGSLADDYFMTGIRCKFAGIIIGMLVAIWSTIRQVRMIQKNVKD